MFVFVLIPPAVVLRLIHTNQIFSSFTTQGFVTCIYYCVSPRMFFACTLIVGQIEPREGFRVAEFALQFLWRFAFTGLNFFDWQIWRQKKPSNFAVFFEVCCHWSQRRTSFQRAFRPQYIVYFMSIKNCRVKQSSRSPFNLKELSSNLHCQIFAIQLFYRLSPKILPKNLSMLAQNNQKYIYGISRRFHIFVSVPCSNAFLTF